MLFVGSQLMAGVMRGIPKLSGFPPLKGRIFLLERINREMKQFTGIGGGVGR